MRTKHSSGALWHRLLLLVLSAGVLLMSSPHSQARSPERPVVLLSCPDGLAPYDPLCQTMIQTLAKTVSGPHVIRRVPRGQETPDRAGDIGIALHIAERSQSAVSGHLEWRVGRGGVARTGPVVRMATKGSNPLQQSFEKFTHDLLKATLELHAALRSAA